LFSPELAAGIVTAVTAAQSLFAGDCASERKKVMGTVKAGTWGVLKNVLYLTDFSEPSEAALLFAEAVVREYEGKVYALHVFTPFPMACATPESTAAMIEGQEEWAQAEMQRLESQLIGLPHEIIMERGIGVWPSVEDAIKECAIDLIILGTHGRTGAEKLLLGSVAEEVFRRSHVPVLTIGPWARKDVHKGAKFHRVLFATDFTPESLAAAPYAISMAQKNQARLILLNVMREKVSEESVANAMGQLHELVPTDAESRCRPESVVQYGDPAERILQTAKERAADLIILGVRNAAGHLGAATHLGRTTAHRVVAHAMCPVLTVRV
jgi:nucleotide-binding universal stress UspA family protein